MQFWNMCIQDVKFLEKGSYFSVTFLKRKNFKIYDFDIRVDFNGKTPHLSENIDQFPRDLVCELQTRT